MSILSITTEVTGQASLVPQEIYIKTNDTLATVTTAGYLNQARSQGFDFANTQLAHVYGIDFNDGGPGCLDFQVQTPTNPVSGNFSLVLISNGTSGTVTSVGTGGPLSGGPITTSGTVTVANNAITYNYLQQSADNRLLGNATGSPGNIAEIPLDANSMGFSAGQLAVKLQSGGGLERASGGLAITQNYIASIQTSVGNSEILNLSAAPALLLPNALLQSFEAFWVESVMIELTGATNSFAAGSNIYITYGNTGTVAASDKVTNTIVNSLTNGELFYLQGGLYSTPIHFTDLIHTSLYLSVDGADFTTGNGGFVVYIRYSVFVP